jgi:alginate O-acetyltransferase complex protein AlgI
MFFNSFEFLIFLPIVFFFYWVINKQRVTTQNALLLLASYYFYACWDWRFLFLLLFSTALDYFSAIKISEAKSLKERKIWLWLCVSINIGFLGVFKYYNFFASSFAELLSNFGLHPNFVVLKVILPVGISFYTFHGLSYIIDVYKDRIQPEKNGITYALFVSYFPLLVAGPIERATHLLPQLKKKRVFDYHKAIEGVYQIVWGLFKKMVIADSCAVYADQIFDNYESMNSVSLILGAFYFAFQIYGDFSGYSDIAIGVSKLFGINLIRNFNYPYFSRDIAEFWRRWHISLSSWFRDYLYIPLGGSRGGLLSKIKNTCIIFIVSGFWHGASWNFIFWGFLNALYFLPLLISNKNRVNIDIVAKGKTFPTIKEFLGISFTFMLTMLAWIFFRAKTISAAIEYIKRILNFDFQFKFQYLAIERYAYELLFLVAFFILIEWNSREKEHPFFGKYALLKLSICIFGILTLGVYSDSKQFIYFQF